MAKRIWKDRVVERPRTFNINNNPDGTITLVPSPGTIIQEGTPVNSANLNGLEEDLESHKADTMSYSTYKTNVDANGIFRELQYKRQNGTLILKSVLSGGTSPKYTTRTETEYEQNGITVKVTRIYTITYTNDKVTSEVLQ